MAIAATLGSNRNPLDLVEGDLVVGAIVEFGRPRRLMRRDLLRMFQLPPLSRWRSFLLRGTYDSQPVPRCRQRELGGNRHLGFRLR